MVPGAALRMHPSCVKNTIAPTIDHKETNIEKVVNIAMFNETTLVCICWPFNRSPASGPVRPHLHQLGPDEINPWLYVGSGSHEQTIQTIQAMTTRYSSMIAATAGESSGRATTGTVTNCCTRCVNTTMHWVFARPELSEGSSMTRAQALCARL